MTTWAVRLLDSGLSVYTVRERCGRITALWNWLAKRRIVDRFPTFQKPQAPAPTPVAFREEELRRLFQSARKSAALAVEVGWLDLDNAVCQIPAAARKGGMKSATYHLWPELVPLLRSVLSHAPERRLVWPWVKTEAIYYRVWRRILLDAGLPSDRKHKAHCLRATHATHRQIAGGDATAALGHSDAATTKRHYIDQRLLPPDESRLCVPWGD